METKAAPAQKPYTITDGKVIFDYGQLYCASPEQLAASGLFAEIVERFTGKLARKGGPVRDFILEAAPGVNNAETSAKIVTALKLLTSHTAQEIIAINEDFRRLLEGRELFQEFIEELYNFWRRHERVICHTAPPRSRSTKSGIHRAQFIAANETFKNVALSAYRTVIGNLAGTNPAVYRQLPAGANMGALMEKIEWDCPYEFSHLKEVPFILLTLIEPPLVLYTKSNKRKGKILEVAKLTEDMIALRPSEWFCFPALIGDLLAFIYFHRDYVTLGLSMGNLFETAGYEHIEGKRPDIIMLFGVKEQSLPADTVFHEDAESGIFVGVVRRGDEVDYFGYFKKTALTLHNVAVLKRGRLPLHGAMAHVTLKDGSSANIVLVGDSGAGKSETLEALRALAEDHICDMKIIFDDMGSLGMRDGVVVGYGTETGAFVRLDDLSPEYAYEQFDRAIFMNPGMVNSRLVIPITKHQRLVKGYPVDMALYANNYERVDDEMPAVEFFADAEPALAVFRLGARMAKGTTDEKGIVHTYFANPFGAPQRKAEHEEVARRFFARMFETGVKVGQIRTRLGIEGYEREGPKSASMELFRVIRKLTAERAAKG
jgi:hypothetical protein